jgi:hypothetical protein
MACDKAQLRARQRAESSVDALLTNSEPTH